MIGKHIAPPFARTERKLVRAAQAGNQSAVEYLITEYEPVCALIRSLTRKLDSAGVHHDDLRGAANVALLEALRKFDVDHGVKFTTFAFYYVRPAMLKVLYPKQCATPQKVRLVSLDAGIAGESGDGARFERDLLAHEPHHGFDRKLERALDTDRDAAVRRFVSGLPDSQRDIVVDIFWGDRSHVEIARQRGVSRPAISRALARSCRRGCSELAAYRPSVAA